VNYVFFGNMVIFEMTISYIPLASHERNFNFFPQIIKIEN
jgi:hypothetical protein